MGPITYSTMMTMPMGPAALPPPLLLEPLPPPPPPPPPPPFSAFTLRPVTEIS